MKNLNFYFMSILVLFLAGCDQSSLVDSPSEPTLMNKLQFSTVDDQGKVVNHNASDYLTSPLRDGQNFRTENPNQIVNAAFRTESGSKYNLMAISNEDGISGDWQIDSPTLGHVYLKAVCVDVVDNVGTIAALVTEIERQGRLGLNYMVYFKLTDNGEGGNNPSDQTTDNLIFYPDWFLFYPTVEDFLVDYSCETLSSIPLWAPNKDVKGQIQVK